jgi:hypothetical protein
MLFASIQVGLTPVAPAAAWIAQPATGSPHALKKSAKSLTLRREACYYRRFSGEIFRNERICHRRF